MTINLKNMEKQNDVKLLKIFCSLKNPDYAGDLNIKYEMEYYTDISLDIIKGRKKLYHNLNDFSKEFNDNIRGHISERDKTYDKMYYEFTKLVLEIANKYYNQDGTKK